MIGQNLNILIECTVDWLYFSSMPVNKMKSKLNTSGQAAVEYLLTLTVVFIAFAGVSILFANQVNHYLSWLFDLIVLPF